MGDRYILMLDCAYCRGLNDDVWYAPTCGSITFTCIHCNKKNYIKDLKAVKKEDISVDDLFDAFMDATNVCWDNEEIERIKDDCKRILQDDGEDE